MSDRHIKPNLHSTEKPINDFQRVKQRNLSKFYWSNYQMEQKILHPTLNGPV